MGPSHFPRITPLLNFWLLDDDQGPQILESSSLNTRATRGVIGDPKTATFSDTLTIVYAIKSRQHIEVDKIADPQLKQYKVKSLRKLNCQMPQVPNSTRFY